MTSTLTLTFFFPVSVMFCQAIVSLLPIGCWSHPVAEGLPGPIIGPDVFSLASLQPVTLLYQPLAIVQPQNGLPAPEGAVFEGPDPGLNANIIGKSVLCFGVSQGTVLGFFVFFKCSQLSVRSSCKLSLCLGLHLNY